MIVADILKLDQGITLLVGGDGLRQSVTYIDVVEIPEGMYWTKAHDFIITTGYFFSGDAALFEQLIHTLVQNGVAGLGIKMGKYVQEIPQAVADYAEAYGFPILGIPLHFSYREVTQPLLESLENDRAKAQGFRTETAFFEALVRGSLAEPQEISDRALQCSIVPSALRYLLLLRSETPILAEQMRALAQACQQAANAQCCCFRFDQVSSCCLILQPKSPELFDGEKKDSFRQVYDAAAAVLEERSLRLGVSEPCHALAELREAAAHTSALLALAPRLHPEEQIFSVENHFLELLLGDNRDHYVRKQLQARYITPLRQLDAWQHTELLKTLEMLCLHDFNITEAGAALYLHRNTVYNRMKRMEEVLNCRMEDPHTQSQLLLACTYDLICRTEQG